MPLVLCRTLSTNPLQYRSVASDCRVADQNIAIALLKGPPLLYNDNKGRRPHGTAEYVSVSVQTRNR